MSSCLISGKKKYSLDLAQYIIWSKFHIQTTKKKKKPLKKKHILTHAYTQSEKNEADTMQHFLARLLGKCININTPSFLSY